MFLQRAWKAALACCLIGSAALAQPGGITTGGSSQRPIIVRGRVALSDGGRLPEKVQIELLCNDQSQPQGRTDEEGNFSVELGARRFEGAGDASIGSAAAGAGFGGPLNDPAKVRTQVDGASIISLLGCSLRASLKGYISEHADVSRVRLGEPANVGTIVLRKIPGDQGSTVSATSLAAPRNARQSLEKAREQIARNRLAEAEKELARALQIYPKYAEAWQELGAVLSTQNRRAEARKAFQEAIASDSRFPKPYLSLALLSATERNWKDALENSEALAKIAPNEYPQGYYYGAVAQYNLQNYEKAAASALRAVELDPGHTVPLAEQLLGVLYSMKGDYKAAAQYYRAYLEHVPPNTNVEAVKTRLAEAEAKAEQTGK